MPNHIVVAMEGADAFVEASGCALDCAARIAARAGADLSMLHVEPPVIDHLGSFTPYQYEGVVEARDRDKQKRTERTRKELSTLGKRMETTWSVHADASFASGPVRTTTERLARLRQGDLLVARYGDAPCRSGYLRPLPERVVRDLTIPVLFVRADTCPMLGDLACVLVLLDGTRYAEVMLPLARRLVNATAGRLHLLVTVRPHAVPAVMQGRSPRLTSRTEAEAYLESVARGPELSAIDVDWTVVVEADTIDALRSVTERARANLAATMVRGQGLLTRAFRVDTRRILEGLSVPLLAWHSPGRARAHGPGPRAG